MKARPIWISGKEREMNVHAVFSTEVEVIASATLHIAGTAFYRIYVNGEFIAFGPARTAGGYVREDVFALESGKKEIVIEAVGYYCHSLSTVFQSSFIMAEVQSNNQIIAYTGKDFKGYLPQCKVQKVERFSVQRHFTEIWDYREFQSLTEEKNQSEVVVLTDVPKVIERKAPYPLCEDILLKQTNSRGNLVFDETLKYKKQRYSWSEVPETWGCFEWDEISHHPFSWIQRHHQRMTDEKVALPVTLKKGEYAILDFGRIEAGFLLSDIETVEESDVVIAFSEFYEGEKFQFSNINMHSVLEYFLGKQTRRNLQSFEPYTFRFAIVAVKEGEIKLHAFGAKTYMFDIGNVTYLDSKNETLNSIYRAAVRTFAHNAVDIYFDCPSRERAGWLCDSYFTAKTEYVLTEKTKVEDAFLENYRLFENDGALPKGVIPECYPADVPPKGEFIPQWTMWYILEVEEYINKRGHQDMKEVFRNSIYGLLGFYRNYENEDGLLETLPSWNFVEWSIANQWTQDVNYPTQFLYAQVLESIYKIYGDEECLKRSAKVRKTAIEQSFNGRYFLDHAIRDEKGVLCLQNEHSSEACQYYAILFGGIDLDSDKYKELKHLVLNVFSPDRNGAMPEIFEVNAFIGAYLRMETLLKMKEYHLVLKDIEGFFGAMEEKTGTLWEYHQYKGSQDHGFASYVLVVIEEALKAL